MPEMKGDELMIKVHQKFSEIITVMLVVRADESGASQCKNKAKNAQRCVPTGRP